MANCSQFLRCRVIALPLQWLQLLLLLLLLQLPPSILREVTCPTPRSVEHADIQVKSHSVKSRERYVCNSGFKRQAGTSNLIQCILDQNSNTAHWTEPSLKCIRDPALVRQKPTSSTTEELLTPTGKASPALAGTVLKPVSKDISSEPPSATVTITTRNWSFTALAQTTAQTMEQSSPTTHGIIPDAQYNVILPVSVVVSISIPVALLALYVFCFRRRDPVPEHHVEIEEMPMRGGTDSQRRWRRQLTTEPI
ncbi:interleukin-15 receptor subunit alpha isoform X3 [Phascolarctos cinereus]